MGRRKLLTGIILGAIVGGLAALTNKEARTYAKTKLQSSKEATKHYLKNPSEAVKNVKTSFDQFNQSFTRSADSTINALEQIEETLDKFINNQD